MDKPSYKMYLGQLVDALARLSEDTMQVSLVLSTLLSCWPLGGTSAIATDLQAIVWEGACCHVQTHDTRHQKVARDEAS